MKTIIKSLHNTPQKQDSHHQLKKIWANYNLQAQDRTQQTQPTFEQIFENHTITYVSLWRSRAEYRTPSPNVQITPGTERKDMEQTNLHCRETVWTCGRPTEDSQICWGNWHSGVIGERKEEELISFGGRSALTLKVSAPGQNLYTPKSYFEIYGPILCSTSYESSW
jgi:hypothetical protein